MKKGYLIFEIDNNSLSVNFLEENAKTTEFFNSLVKANRNDVQGLWCDFCNEDSDFIEYKYYTKAPNDCPWEYNDYEILNTFVLYRY